MAEQQGFRQVWMPLDVKGNDGKFYTTYSVPEGVPLGPGVIYVGPSEDLLYPKYNAELGIWMEDKDSIIENYKTRIAKLEEKVQALEAK